MSHSQGPWIYDAESGAVHTKDRTGYWGPDHYPVEVCAVAALDGVNNGPLLAAAPELLEALKKRAVVDAAYSRLALMDADDDKRERLLQQIEDAEEAAFDFSRAAIAKAEGR